MKSETNNTIPKSKLALPVAGRDHIQGRLKRPSRSWNTVTMNAPIAVPPIRKSRRFRNGWVSGYASLFVTFRWSIRIPTREHAAESAEAAGAQGRFWEMHDSLFEHQEALEDEDLARYAAPSGWMAASCSPKSGREHRRHAFGKIFGAGHGPV